MNLAVCFSYIDKLRKDEAEKARLDASATKIQACYRGYVTRRELRLNSQRISKFQLKFREWLRKKKEKEEKEKDNLLEKELSSRKVIWPMQMAINTALRFSNSLMASN